MMADVRGESLHQRITDYRIEKFERRLAQSRFWSNVFLAVGIVGMLSVPFGYSVYSDATIGIGYVPADLGVFLLVLGGVVACVGFLVSGHFGKVADDCEDRLYDIYERRANL